MISRADIERYQQLEMTDGFDAGEFFQEEALDGTATYQEFGKSGVGIIFVGFVAFALGGAVAAGAIGIMGLTHIIDRYSKGQKQAKAIRSGDPRAIVGHLPDTYKEMYVQHLKDEVAIENQTVTVPAQAVATTAQSSDRSSAKSSVPSTSVPLNVPTAQPTVSSTPQAMIMPDVNVSDSLVGRGGKRVQQPTDVTPSSNATSSTPPTTAASPISRVQEVNTDIAGAIAALGCRSIFVAGGSGTAKSLTVCHALKKIKQNDPTVKVWVISGKCSEDESGYWSGGDKLSFWDLRNLSLDQMKEAFAEWLSIIRQFRALQGGAILLVDELSLILTYADELARTLKSNAIRTFVSELVLVLVGLSSAGRSENKGIWAIAPMGAINGLPGLSKAKMGAFIKLFMAQLPDGLPPFDFGVWTDAKANGIAPQDPPSFRDIEQAKRLQCTILCGYTNQWHPCQRYQVPPQDPSVIAQFNRSSPANVSEVSPERSPGAHSVIIDGAFSDHIPEPSSKPIEPPGFDLDTYEQKYSVVHITTTRDGIRAGTSKNKIIKALGINAGTSRAYKDWLELYSYLESRQSTREAVGVAGA